MTRSAPLWQQNSTYPAVNDRILIGTLWPTSASSGGAPTAQANTLSISVAAGVAAVALSAGNYSALCRWDAPEVVTLAAGPASGSRIDLVVLQVRDAAIDAGSFNDFLFQVVPGTASGTPTAPPVPANAYAICAVTVPTSAVNLNAATVTDRRATMTQLQGVAGTCYASAGGMGMANANLFSTLVAGTLRGGVTVGSGPGGVGLVAPVTGLYQVSGMYDGQMGGAASGAICSIAVNGVSVATGTHSPPSVIPANQFFGVQAAALVAVNAGQVIQLFGFANASNTTINAPNTPAYNYLHAALVSN